MILGAGCVQCRTGKTLLTPKGTVHKLRRQNFWQSVRGFDVKIIRNRDFFNREQLLAGAVLGEPFCK